MFRCFRWLFRRVQDADPPNRRDEKLSVERPHGPRPYRFKVVVDDTGMYSEALQKVFTDINKPMYVRVKVTSPEDGGERLAVRVLPVFKSERFAHLPVEPCLQHVILADPTLQAHSDDNDGVCWCSCFNHARHLVHSTSPSAIFEYDDKTARHSVVVPLGALPRGEQTIVIPYHFTCRSHCQRKQLALMFTLETLDGHVLGRQHLSIGICSRPRGSKAKEEMRETQSKAARKPRPNTKKRTTSLQRRLEVARKQQNLRRKQRAAQRTGKSERYNQEQRLAALPNRASKLKDIVTEKSGRRIKVNERKRETEFQTTARKPQSQTKRRLANHIQRILKRAKKDQYLRRRVAQKTDRRERNHFEERLAAIQNRASKLEDTVKEMSEMLRELANSHARIDEAITLFAGQDLNIKHKT